MSPGSRWSFSLIDQSNVPQGDMFWWFFGLVRSPVRHSKFWSQCPRVSFWIRFWLDYYIIISLLLKYGEGDDRNEGAQTTPVVFCGGQVVSSHVGDREKHGRTTPKTKPGLQSDTRRV